MNGLINRSSETKSEKTGVILEIQGNHKISLETPSVIYDDLDRQIARDNLFCLNCTGVYWLCNQVFFPQ